MSMLVKPDLTPEREVRRGCEGKVKHVSRKGATDHLKRLMAAQPGHVGLTVYWCGIHGGYHVGHVR